MDDDDFDADQGQGYDEAQADPMLADTKDGGDFNRRDCVLFVIDARRAMFANKCGDVAFAHVALACAADCMAERVVSADSDLVGVLLVGTARSANDFGFERAAVLCPLAEPRAVQIRELRNIIADANLFGADGGFDKDRFGEPAEDAVVVSEALHLAQMLMSELPKAKGASKRVFWLTCYDHAGDVAKPQAVIRARDMLDQNISIHPILLRPHGAAHGAAAQPHFNLDAFWRDVIAANRPAPGEGELGAGELGGEPPLALLDDGSADAVRALVRRTSSRRLARKRVTLSLPSGQQLGLSFISLARKRALPSRALVESQTNELVVASTRLTCYTTGKPISAEFGIGHMYAFGEEFAQFEPGERSRLCAFGEPVLRCLGFKPAELLKAHHCVGPAIFATADSHSVAGSAVALRALVQTMAAKEVVMIAAWVAKGSAPRLLALAPQLEARSPNGTVLRPLGLVATPLPYADDIREPPLVACAAPPRAEAVDAARAVVRALRCEYEPRPSPVLATFYAALEKAALKDTSGDATPDQTLPDAALLAGGADAICVLRDVVFGEEYVEPTEGGGARQAPKRAKASAPESEEDWRALADLDGGLEGLTADVLRGFCEGHSLAKGGAKPVLCKRIRESFAK